MYACIVFKTILKTGPIMINKYSMYSTLHKLANTNYHFKRLYECGSHPSLHLRTIGCVS